jgi:hypothetical protein
MRAQILADFDPNPAVGDRRVELVFIGQVRGTAHCRGHSLTQVAILVACTNTIH